MKVCFTSMNEKSIINVCDIETGKIDHIHHNVICDDHRPFGITWDENKLYVAQPTSIVGFNKSLKDPVFSLTSLWYGTHQILIHDDIMWIVSPRINAVMRYHYKKIKQDIDYFFPDEAKTNKILPYHFMNENKLTSTKGDISHYNSIFIHDDRLYMTAHNHDKPSFISVFKYPALTLVARYEEMGRHIHNIFVENDEIWTIDSLGSQNIVSTRGRSISIGKHGEFVRGMAATKQYFIVGCFPYNPKRHGRKDGDSSLVVVDRQKGKIVKKINVKDVGNINDIRILDEPDLCHGVKPLWDHNSDFSTR